jgi:hypothetical protein
VARHLRVPGIVDVVLVSNPAEIRALNDHPKIDRNFIPLGPMMNRFIVGRIRRCFEIMGQLLPSLTPRDNRVRVDRQQQLAAALDSEHESSRGSMLWKDAALARMRALRALPTATTFSDDAVLGQCLGRHRSTRVDMWTITTRNAYTVFRKGRDWGFHHFRKLSRYVAEPTDGLWLRPPYLHNGSVPTLADLLEQPQNRPKAFPREELLDSARCGFAATPYDSANPRKGEFCFDTKFARQQQCRSSPRYRSRPGRKG